MAKNKSSISQAKSYKEIGEYWDTHDLTEHWDNTKSVEFEVELDSEVTYYPIEASLSAKLNEVAEHKGISPETLVNLWVQDKLREEAA